MNLESEIESFDLPALWSDLQDLEDDSLATDKRVALTDLLDRSPAARRAYFEYFHQVAVLRMEADKLMEKEQFADIIKPLHVRTWWYRSWTGAFAAVILFGLVLSFLLMGRFNIPKPMPRVAIAPSTVVEQLEAVASSGTNWEINHVRQTGVAKVMPGNTIQVLSGAVKFEFKSGSIMVLQAPSKVTFNELRKPLLEQGLLWIDTGATDDTFEVSTSDVVVRDIGTRFGVRVDEKNRSEIHVHEGGVNIFSRESGIELVTLAAVGKGQAITADGVATELPLIEDPFPALQSLFSGDSKYRSVILAQNPISYLKFDGGIDGRYDNEVRGRRTAKSGPSVTIHSTGVNEDPRFQGFDPKSKSLYFPPHPHKSQSKSIVAFLDGEAGISQRHGSVTFWVKQSQDTSEDQVLWLAAGIKQGKHSSFISHAYTQINATGHVVFTLGNGNENVVLTSDQTIHDSQWHYLSITWGTNSASLYLDGKQVAHRSDLNNLEEWTSTGNYVRFGKPTDELYPKGLQNFHGWLDEFAIWDRLLTPEEISKQYKAAVGAGE